MGASGAWLGGLVQAGTIGLGTGMAGMAGIGAMTGAASSGILGGNVGQGALLGGIGGGLGFGLGGAFTKGFTSNYFWGGLGASTITGGVVGGVGAELNGGSFFEGALPGAGYGAAAFFAGYGMGTGYSKYQQARVRAAVARSQLSVDKEPSPKYNLKPNYDVEGQIKSYDLVPENENIKVIGRRYDTDVAKGWPGHEVLDVPDNVWSQSLNDAWIQEGINSRQTFYTASPETPANVQYTIYGRELMMIKGSNFYMRVEQYYIPNDK